MLIIQGGKPSLIEALYIRTIQYCYNRSCFNEIETDTHCQMIQGNFLKLSTKDWRDADIVFANSTCYDEALMSSMGMLLYSFKYKMLYNK